MALDPDVAAQYGTVVAVDLTQLEGTWPRVADECDGVIGEIFWQAHAFYQAVPPSALRLVGVFERENRSTDSEKEGT